MNRFRKGVLYTVLLTTLGTSALPFGMPAKAAAAGAASAAGTAANLDFETGDLTGWSATGNVAAQTADKHGGTSSAKLAAANATLSQKITGLPQGSYTLSAWVKGSTSGNTAWIGATGTGGPDSRMMIDTFINGTSWTQIAIRNVLVYNGEANVTFASGNGTNLAIDDVQLTLDSNDDNPVANWGFEDASDPLTGWHVDQGAADPTASADTGSKGVALSADSQISQVIAVKPNTSYIATVRAKVDRQDTWKTTYQSNYRGPTGQLVDVTAYGDRLNLGVKGMDGTVLRQAPSGTEGYSLLTVAFKTGPSDSQVTLYANTINDAAYRKSVAAHNSDGWNAPSDQWQGNGNDKAYVDNFDVFEMDDTFVRGADVSFLPLIEDKGGKYFANGVQQDCLTILSNHGVNAVLNMIFVHAGSPIYDQSSPKQQQFTGFTDENGNPFPYTMQEGYFDKVHSYQIGERATELGMGYMPSFHYSDGWMSAGKAFTPLDWMTRDSSGKLADQTLDQLTTTMYNYVYDFMKGLVDQGTNIIAVKHGNEQDGGIAWPTGKGYSSAGFKALINASVDAAKAAAPNVPAFIHSNNGYTPTYSNTMFGTLQTNGTKFDGMGYSLYSGHPSSDAMSMIVNNNTSFPDKDYLDVETGFAFTKYNPDMVDESGSMGQTIYYQQNANGQYNWLLNFMQAQKDVPNPHNRMRGFFYWETDWIVVEGAGASTGDGNTVDRRIMFNNGDPAIKEMGSTANGKMGDMMDSMYAYLWRGKAKAKPDTMLTPLQGYGTYSVTPTHPTGVTLDQASVSLTAGQTKRLNPTIAPADGILDSRLTWSSSDPSVAKVDASGTVTAVSAGTAAITATTVDGGFTAQSTVNVTSATEAGAGQLALTVNGAALSGSPIAAKAWDQLTLKAALPAATTDKTVQFESSDPTVASFIGETWQTSNPGRLYQQTDVTQNVKLKVNRDGTSVITARSADGTAVAQFSLNASKVAVTGVTLDKTSATLSLGRNLQLTAAVAPSDASFKDVTWTSSDPTVATVDGQGLVASLKTGTTTIRVTSVDDPAKYAECVVSVVPVQVTGLTLDKSTLNLMVGTSKPLVPIIAPDDAANKTIDWHSSDESIATVDGMGNVTGVAEGTATVTATTADGGFTASATVKVQTTPVAVTGVRLNKNEYDFASDYFSSTNPSAVAPSVQLTAEVQPADATNTDVAWTSDNPAVAKVDAFGKVTAISAGKATITARTAEGGFAAAASVYVPAISESFDNRSSSDNWSTSVGTAGGSGALGGSVTAVSGNNVFQVSGGGSGVRSIQKTFPSPVQGKKVAISFDWNVGKAASTDGGMLSIEDTAGKRYLTLQTKTATELVYGTGGTASNTAIAGTKIGSGFNVDNTTYHVYALLNFAAKKIDLTVSSLANPALTSTIAGIPFDSATTYTNTVGKIQFALQRSSGTSSWTSWIDNFNVYPAAAVPVSVKLNEPKVSLLPIPGTPGYTAQLQASVLPVTEEVDQTVTWASSDPSVAKVDGNGLVTAVTEGTATVTATSVANPALSASVTVDVHPVVPLEALAIKDANGNAVEDTTIPLSSGTVLQLYAAKNPGVADTISETWTTSDPDVVEVDSATGRVTAVGPGTATVTLTVDNYAAYGGYIKTQSVDFEVSGDVQLRTSALAKAIEAAHAAKTQPDDYYTPDSLAAYQAALLQAEQDLAAAAADHWDASKQPVIDQDKTNLEAATAGLAASSNVPVSALTISAATMKLTAGKTGTLTVTAVPDYASNKSVTWASDHPDVAAVDANGTVTALTPGTATITATAVNGGATAKSTVTVGTDLSTGYASNGGSVSASKERSGNAAANAILNASTMNMTGAAWSTGGNLQTTSPSEYWQIDLGSQARIDNVKTVFWQTMKYVIQVSSNGTDWTAAVDHSGAYSGATTALYTDTMPANTYGRYIRVVVLGVSTTSDWVGMVIFQANGAFLPAPADVMLDRDAATIEVGQTLALQATLSPINADPRLAWTSSDASVATVDGTGTVTAHKAGSATIAVETANGIRKTALVTVADQVVRVAGVTLDRTDLALTAGDTSPLIATVAPADASDKRLTWASSDAAVATVDGSGLVTAVAAGTATITATTVDGGFSASATLTVTNAQAPVDKTHLQAAIVAAQALNESSYTADSWSALLTALAAAVQADAQAGATQAEVNAALQQLQDAIQALVPAGGPGQTVSVAGVTLDRTSLALKAGETILLTATVEPADASDKRLTWTSSDSVVAVVYSSGQVAAISAGTATITVTTVDGGFSASATVTVTDAAAPVDKTHLQAAIAAAQALNEAGYTADSWSALQAALAAAVQADARADAAQAEVNAALQQLQDAIQALVPAGGPGQTVSVTGVTLDRTALALTAGATSQLTATVAPADASDKRVTWASSDPAVAEVNAGGLVTAVSAGTATITATTADGGFAASATVTVEALPPVTPPITPTPPVVVPKDPAAIVGRGTITIQPVVDGNGLASVSVKAEDVGAALQGASDGKLHINVTPASNAKQVEVNLPATALASNGSVDTVVIDAGLASVSVDTGLLRKSDGSAAGSLQLTVAAAAAPGGRPAYDVQISIDGQRLSALNEGSVQVGIPYTLQPGEKASKVVVFYANEMGGLEVVRNGKYNSATGRVEFTAARLGSYSAAYADATFADLGSAAWARDAIEALAARGAIRGTGSGEFRPNAIVTRAEFVQMLMETFGLQASGAGAAFTDVQEGAWYADAIGAARKLGIVKGKSDGSFGVNDPISRQDMAVMLQQAAKVLNLSLPKGGQSGQSAVFSDAEAISSYAADAVSGMTEAGVLNGMGDGRFAPRDNSTRAQAAAVLYRLFFGSPS